MTPDDDERLDRAARDIKDAVDACWRLLADLDIDAKALAVDKLDEKFALEQLTHEPESAPGRAH